MTYYKKQNNRYTFADPSARRTRGRAGNPKRKIRDLDTGEIYESVKAAHETTGVSKPEITRVAKGHKESAKGHRFEYYIEPKEGGETTLQQYLYLV